MGLLRQFCNQRFHTKKLGSHDSVAQQGTVCLSLKTHESRCEKMKQFPLTSNQFPAGTQRKKNKGGKEQKKGKRQNPEGRRK